MAANNGFIFNERRPTEIFVQTVISFIKKIFFALALWIGIF